MICPECFSEAEDETSNFCESCGTSLKVASPLPVTQCRTCGGMIEVASQFCEHCGVAQPDHCPKCNAVIAPTAAFCTRCGTARPASAKPMLDLNQFEHVRPNVNCTFCHYRGPMPVIDAETRNYNPVANVGMISTSIVKTVGFGLVRDAMSEAMTQTRLTVLCPQCRSKGQVKA